MTTSLEFGICICYARAFSTECILLRSAVITNVGAAMRCKTPSLARSKFESDLLRPFTPSRSPLVKSVFQYAIISFDAFEPSRSRCGIGEGSAIRTSTPARQRPRVRECA